MGGTVVVGIGSLDLDAMVLDWASDQAQRAHDALYVVHAYRRLVSADRYWPRLVHANDARRSAAQHVVSSAAQLAHARHRDLSVDGSSIAGATIVVLRDVSHVAELLVLGRQATTPPRAVLALAAEAACPVVFVGAEPRTDGPVVLLLGGDTAADGFTAAVEFAFATAEQRDAGLLVIQADAPARAELRVTQTERQEQLDAALAGWQQRHPGVGVTVELRTEPVADSLRWAAAAGQLLVLAHGCTDAWAAFECRPHQAAICVVPAVGRHDAGHKQDGREHAGEKVPVVV